MPVRSRLWVQNLTMEILTNYTFFKGVIITMTVLAVIVFVALHYFKAGYGYLRTSNWGPEINNKVGWVLMECPVFFAVLWGFVATKSYENVVVAIMTGLFLVHYFQRSFIFPLLMRGNSTIPVAIVVMGIVHNLANAYMQSGWLFIFGREGYTLEWLYSPQFILGTCIFIFGFVVNLQADYIVRHLRKPGDRKHYIPYGGMFKYVSSANYFGEITEWFGFAILTWSISGLVFFLFTFANLAPRAFSLYERYEQEFGEEFTNLGRKKIIPFLY